MMRWLLRRFLIYAMKYSSKIYAKALTQAILAKKQDIILERFVRLLVQNSDMAKAQNIIALTERMLLFANGNKKIVLQTARLIEDLADKFADKGDLVIQEINPDLVAGVNIIIDDERQLDISLKAKLEKLFAWAKKLLKN